MKDESKGRLDNQKIKYLENKIINEKIILYQKNYES